MNLINQIVQGDCVQVLKSMTSNSVDLVVTDAAHGIVEAADSGVQEDEDSELILKAWSAAAGRDIPADIEAARQELERARTEDEAEFARYHDEHPDKFAAKRHDLDDDIPF